MQLFIFLILLIQLTECNDYGKDSSLTKNQLLSLPIPDLAPYDSTNDPLAALSSTQKIYIQSLFTKSIYYQKCDKPPKPIIQPIYFWPGKRVELECRMCHRSFVYNGFIKHWSTLRYGILDEIININSKKTVESNEWKIIDQKFSDNFVFADFEAQKKIPIMPQREKSDNPSAIPKEAYRPRTQFFQRDGKLIILHPHMDSYGLYRCFDYESSKIVNFVYLLIPITPIFTMLGWKVHLHQCRRNPILTKFRYFDEFHQFHFLPAILPKQEDICPIFKTTSTPQDYCSVDKFNEISQPSLSNIVNVSLFEHKDDEKLIAEKTNLKIFISWSEWSSCSSGEAMKTRYGFCHIGKLDPSKQLPADFNDGEAIKKIHKFLENVEEFKVNGIQLFSGILADIINPYGHNSTHCDNYDKSHPWNEIQKSMINLIKTVTKDTLSEIRKRDINGGRIPDNFHLYESACLRSADAPQSVEYGQKIIQNEPC